MRTRLRRLLARVVDTDAVDHDPGDQAATVPVTTDPPPDEGDPGQLEPEPQR